MKSRKRIYALVAVVVLVIAWAAFRPERLFVNAKVNEAFPSATSGISDLVLATGNFHSVAHNSKGVATIHQLADGRRMLRLTNFETSNGPDVRVYLGVANDASDSDTVKKAGFVELGAMKGNIGDQNYDLPSNLDLAQYHSVTIWCKRFSVNFATAPLSSAQPTAALQN